MTKRILWVSRHAMEKIQMGALRRMYGDDVQVTEDPRPFESAETIVRRFREGDYDDIIVVAPYSVLWRMIELGLQPLWSEAQVVADRSRSDWNVRDRYYRFLRFRRVKRFVIEFEELGPEAVRLDGD